MGLFMKRLAARKDVALKLRGVSFPLTTLMDRYMFREMIGPFFLWLLAWLVVLGGNEFYWALKQSLSMPNAPFKELLLLVYYRLPAICTIALPCSMLFTTGTALNRLGREHEVMAFCLGGVPNWRIVMPFLIVGLLASCADFWLYEKAVPWANHRATNVQRSLLFGKFMPPIREAQFLKLSHRYYFYVDHVERETGVLRGVMIYERDPNDSHSLVFPRVMLADYARKEGKVFKLYNVKIHSYDKEGRQIMQVLADEEVLDLHEPIDQFWSANKTQIEMSSGELKDFIGLFDQAGASAPPEYNVEYYWKFALPAACFILTLWAAPLVLHFCQSGSFAGLIIAVAGIFVYQGWAGFSQGLGIYSMRGYVAAVGHSPPEILPIVAAWSQNILFGLMGLIWLLRKR